VKLHDGRDWVFAFLRHSEPAPNGVAAEAAESHVEDVHGEQAGGHFDEFYVLRMPAGLCQGARPELGEVSRLGLSASVVGQVVISHAQSSGVVITAQLMS
jgi:hypothetical protein